MASCIGDGACDRDDVYATVAIRHSKTVAIVPSRANAVRSGAVGTASTQHDPHLRCVAIRGRAGCGRASDCGWRTLVQADTARCKRVVGTGVRFHTDGRQAAEGAIAGEVLNRTVELGRPSMSASYDPDHKWH